MNCTAVENGYSVGTSVLNVASVANSVIWNNTGYLTASSASYSLIQGGAPGPGNIDMNPLFRDPVGPDGIAATGDEDYRLLPGSPAIDAAENGAVGTVVFTDLAGRPRFRDDPRTPDRGLARRRWSTWVRTSFASGSRRDGRGAAVLGDRRSEDLPRRPGRRWRAARLRRWEFGSRSKEES